ncbi:hypothetical protein ACTXT7_011702 [Hymenolepis weldensis]
MTEYRLAASAAAKHGPFANNNKEKAEAETCRKKPRQASISLTKLYLQPFEMKNSDVQEVEENSRLYKGPKLSRLNLKYKCHTYKTS